MNSHYDADERTFRERHAVTIVAALAVIAIGYLWVSAIAPQFTRIGAALVVR